MATLHSMIAGIFDALVSEAATYGAMLLAIVVGLVHLAFRRWLTAGQLAVLWGLVLMRLAIPIVPASPWSLETLVDVVANVGESSGDSSRGSAPATIATTGAMGGAARVAVQEQWEATSVPEATSFDPDVASQWVLATWFLVGLGGLATTIVAHWRFGRRIEKFGRADDRLSALWSQCRAEVGYMGRCRPVVFDEVETPAVTGLFRSTVILPPSAMELADEKLRMILLHELAHLQRRDLAANWLLVILRAVHWWNPLYWLAARRFRVL